MPFLLDIILSRKLTNALNSFYSYFDKLTIDGDLVAAI